MFSATSETVLAFSSTLICMPRDCVPLTGGAAFGVFYPPMVKGFVDEAWKITDAPTVLAAREKGAVAGLNRLIGEDPAGLARATELLKKAFHLAEGASG